jgi:uncharacterized protein YecE (DUF72 family)
LLSFERKIALQSMKEKAYTFPPNYYSGLSGIALPFSKQEFPEAYKDSSRLSYYASLFNSLEVNSIFYKLPMAKTVDNWLSSVPEGFRFTFKLNKNITHVKGLEFKEEDVDGFFKVLAGLKAAAKGCILIQFPPGLSYAHAGQAEALLNAVKKYNVRDEWKIALEFRNKSWYREESDELLQAYNAELVIQDIPRSATPSAPHVNDFIYLRFHGPTGTYNGGYTDSFLSEYAGYIKEWLAEGKTVYVYFNNTVGDAYKNLLSLNRFVGE